MTTATMEAPGLPDMNVSVRQLFGIDADFEVPAYSEATEIEGMSLAQVVDDIWTTLEPICARAGTAK